MLVYEKELSEVSSGYELNLFYQFFDGKFNEKIDENLPDVPVKVSDADIETKVKKYPLMVVDCWAPWCGPYRMIGQIIEELAKEMQVRLFLVNLMFMKIAKRLLSIG
jgi:thiol-disulfide isomerase/thioredoxin